MSERKVLQKYFPPSFDPSLIKRRKMPKDRQEVIRLMAPFSMRCATCGEYIYKGKKFNGRKETVQGEEYYGIKIFRFYIKCTGCSAEITFKTDPKNTDYVAEHGAARNFEPWRDPKHDQADADKLAQLEDEENNPMAALEHKAVDSKREMDILDALQDLKSRNARLERAGRADGAEQRVLDRISSGVEVGDREVRRKLTEFEEARRRAEEEDEEEIRRVFGRTFVDGVPDIGLGGGEGSGSESGEESEDPLTPGGDSTAGEGPASPAPEARSFKAAATAAAANTAAVKRKLDAVEPTAADLLSAAQRSIVANSFGAKPAAASGAGAMGPPPKKKGKANAALAAKLGIRVKGK